MVGLESSLCLSFTSTHRLYYTSSHAHNASQLSKDHHDDKDNPPALNMKWNGQEGQ
jgi:hypothetical protein